MHNSSMVPPTPDVVSSWGTYRTSARFDVADRSFRTQTWCYRAGELRRFCGVVVGWVRLQSGTGDLKLRKESCYA